MILLALSTLLVQVNLLAPSGLLILALMIQRLVALSAQPDLSDQTLSDQNLSAPYIHRPLHNN